MEVHISLHYLQVHSSSCGLVAYANARCHYIYVVGGMRRELRKLNRDF